MASGLRLESNALPPGFSLDQSSQPESSSVPAGFQLDEDKYGGVGGELKAGLAGAARGASFGLSDQALVHSGLVKPDTLQGLKDENPASSFAGEMAGVVAPAFLGDEAGLVGAVSKAGSAVEKGAVALAPEATSVAGNILKSAATKAAGFGTEGAAYGLGQSISEDALGDHDLLSQHTLSNIGLSAALAGGIGSALGAGMGAIGRDASTGAEKLAALKMADGAAPGSAEDIVAQTGLPANEKSRFIEGLTKQKENAAEIQKAGELIGAPVLPGQTSASDYVQSMTSALSQSPTIPGVQTQQMIQKGFDAVQNVTKETLGVGEHLTPFEAGAKIKEQIQNTVDKIYAPLKEGYAADEAAGNAIDLADEPRIKLHDNLVEQGQNFGSRGSKGGKLIEQYAERALAQDTVSQMDKLISEIGGEQRIASRAGDTESANALGQVKETLDDFLDGQITRAGKKMESEGMITAENARTGDVTYGGNEVADDLKSSRKELRKSYREFKNTLNDLTSAGRISKKLNTYGTTEMVLDSIPNEKLVEKMFDPKNSAGLAKLKEKFGDVFDTLVANKKSQIIGNSMKDGSPDVIKVLKELDKLSPEIKKLMFKPEELAKLNAAKTWVESLPKNVGPSGTPKGMAFMDALKNPVSSFLGNVKDFGVKQLLKFSSPQEANKTMLLVNAEKQGLKGAKVIRSGISEILDGAGKSIRPFTGYSSQKIAGPDEYKEKTQQLASLVNNPNNLHDKISGLTEGVYEHAPNFASSLQKTLSNGANFLNSKVPLAPAPNPFTKPADPSKADIAKFNRYYSVVENPMSVLKQIHDHTLTQEAIETLSAVYPKLYDQMKSEVLNQVSEIKDAHELPYKTKMVLSKFLGEPIHPSQTPQSIQSSQSVYNQALANQPQKPMKNKQSGLAKMTLSSRSSLESNDSGN